MGPRIRAPPGCSARPPAARTGARGPAAALCAPASRRRAVTAPMGPPFLHRADAGAAHLPARRPQPAQAAGPAAGRRSRPQLGGCPAAPVPSPAPAAVPRSPEIYRPPPAAPHGTAAPDRRRYQGGVHGAVVRARRQLLQRRLHHVRAACRRHGQGRRRGHRRVQRRAFMEERGRRRLVLLRLPLLVRGRVQARRRSPAACQGPRGGDGPRGQGGVVGDQKDARRRRRAIPARVPCSRDGRGRCPCRAVCQGLWRPPRPCRPFRGRGGRGRGRGRGRARACRGLRRPPRPRLLQQARVYVQGRGGRLAKGRRHGRRRLRPRRPQGRDERGRRPCKVGRHGGGV